MPARKLKPRPQPPLQKHRIYGRGYAYAREVLTNPQPNIGRPPYSFIDAQTLVQHAWADGYNAALRDETMGYEITGTDEDCGPYKT
jgi:hypothetical protein